VSLAADDDVLTIGLNRGVSLLAEARNGVGRGPQLLREIGPHPEGGTVGLYRGRYGPYVSHEGIHASLPKGADPDNFPLEAAVELLATQRAKGGAKGKQAAKARRPARKTASAAKAAPAEFAATKASPANAATPAARRAKAPARPVAPKRTTSKVKAPAKKAAKRTPQSAAGE
jgi:DNA topoisomerase-1